MGQLRRRGSIWWVRYYRNGKRYEESSGSDKKGKAIDLLKIREGDGAHGIPVTPKIGRLRFEEAAADVVTDYRVNGKRSLAHVEGRIENHLTPYFGGRRMATITTADVRAYTAARLDAGTAKPASVNRELAVLKRAFTLAVRAGTLVVEAAHPDARGAQRRGILRARAVRGGPRPSPSPARGDDVRVLHRLAGAVRGAAGAWARSMSRRRWAAEGGTTKNQEARSSRTACCPSCQGDRHAAAGHARRKKGTICPWVFHRRASR